MSKNYVGMSHKQQILQKLESGQMESAQGIQGDLKGHNGVGHTQPLPPQNKHLNERHKLITTLMQHSGVLPSTSTSFVPQIQNLPFLSTTWRKYPVTLSCKLSLRTITSQLWSGKQAECIEHIQASYNARQQILLYSFYIGRNPGSVSEDRE